jgi:aryl-alcohol dehydrogenase-like predicted oxidoreductase
LTILIIFFRSALFVARPAKDNHHCLFHITKSDDPREPQAVGRLPAVGARHGRSPGEIAIACNVAPSAVIGARSLKRVNGIIGAMDFRLTPSEIAEVEGPKKRNDFGEPILYSFLASEIPAPSIEKAQRP